MNLAEKREIETQESVIFFDTDAGGVVHNLAYLRMIETCRTELASVWTGKSMQDMAEKNFFFALTKTEIRYLSPARLSDVLKIKGKIERFSVARVKCSFEIYREKALLVKCEQELALIRLPEGKAVKISQIEEI